MAYLALLTSVLTWSTTGLFVRIADLDVPGLLFWRGISGAISIAVVLYLRNFDFAAFARLGRSDWIVILLTVSGAICNVTSLYYAPIASVVSVALATPVFVVVIEVIFRGRRLQVKTVAGCLAIAIGSALNFSYSDWKAPLALAIAMGVPLCIALGISVIRNAPRLAVMPTTGLSSLVLACLFIAFAHFSTIGYRELAIVLVFGLTQTWMGSILFTYGSRKADPTANAFLQVLEVPVAILLVWWIVGERPAPEAVVGGGLIVAAALLHHRF